MDVHKKDLEQTLEMDDPFDEFGPNFEVLDTASIADAVEYDQQLRASMRKKKFGIFNKRKRDSLKYLNQGTGTSLISKLWTPLSENAPSNACD